MKRNDFLDFAKGVLILLVTVGHSIQFVILREANYWGDPYFRSIYMFHMPLFMAIAGYLSCRSIQKTTAPEFIRRGFFAYVVPIIAWAFLSRVGVSILNHEKSFVDLPLAIFREATGSHWFLWSLFGSISLTAIINAPGRYFLPMYLLSSFAVFLLPETDPIYLFKFTYPFYQIGYLVATRGIPAIFAKTPAVVFLASSSISVTCFLLWRDETYIYNSRMTLSATNAMNIVLRYVAGASGSLVALYGMRWAQGPFSMKVNRLFYAIGRDSMYIYIIQTYAFTLAGRLASRFALPRLDIVTSWLLASVCGLVICLACWICGAILARNAFLSRILFGKTKKAANPTPSAAAVGPCDVSAGTTA